MLKEKNMISVSWDKALPQLIYDDRYSSFPKEYRKLVYEDYVKMNNVDRMREEIKTKEKTEEEIRKMMEEYHKARQITATTEYRDFEQIAKNNKKFLKYLQSNKEIIIREFFNEVKKAKDEGVI